MGKRAKEGAGGRAEGVSGDSGNVCAAVRHLGVAWPCLSFSFADMFKLKRDTQTIKINLRA